MVKNVEKKIYSEKGACRISDISIVEISKKAQVKLN